MQKSDTLQVFFRTSHHCFHCPHFSCLEEFEMKVFYVTNANSSRSLASYLSCLHWHLLHDSLLVMYLKLGSWVHSKNLWWACNEGPLFWSRTILIIITGVIVTTRHHIGFEPVSRHGTLWNPSNCYTNPHNKDTGSSKQNSSVTLVKWRFLQTGRVACAAKKVAWAKPAQLHAYPSFFAAAFQDQGGKKKRLIRLFSMDSQYLKGFSKYCNALTTSKALQFS